MDFVHDQLATGRKIRVLTIVDTFSRFSPAIVPRFSFRAPDVIEVLERVGREIGLPKTIRVDQGEPSSSPATSTSGPISGTSRSTSRGPTSPPTTPSSRA
jgi:putative transposase